MAKYKMSEMEFSELRALHLVNPCSTGRCRYCSEVKRRDDSPTPTKAKKRSDITDIDVCLAVEEYQKEKNLYPYELLADKFNCDEKLAYSACERAFNHDLIDYGVSLRTGWLTEKGKQLISNPTNPEESVKESGREKEFDEKFVVTDKRGGLKIK